MLQQVCWYPCMKQSSKKLLTPNIKQQTIFRTQFCAPPVKPDLVRSSARSQIACTAWLGLQRDCYTFNKVPYTRCEFLSTLKCSLFTYFGTFVIGFYEIGSGRSQTRLFNFYTTSDRVLKRSPEKWPIYFRKLSLGTLLLTIVEVAQSTSKRLVWEP